MNDPTIHSAAVPHSPHADRMERLGDCQRAATLRILDANANRAAEGLRVIEEYARFVLEDRYLTSQWKQLRHDLAGVLAAIPAVQRCAARETQFDVGTTIATPDEYQRDSLREIVLASQKRVEQALRCLEEYGKPFSAELAAGVESLRYRAYTLGRALLITDESLAELAHVRLYVLIDGRDSPAAFASLAESLVAAGVNAVQLRDKRLGDRDLLSRGHVLRQVTRGTGTYFIMNDRPDLAVLADADGVHLGQEDMRVKDARRIVGEKRLIGVSTHSLPQARQAVLDGANYLGCGPTFPSSTKEFAAFPGVDFLRQVSDEIGLFAFAVGGITLDNLDRVVAAGFSRVAVGAAVTSAEDPAQVAGLFLARLSAASENLEIRNPKSE